MLSKNPKVKSKNPKVKPHKAKAVSYWKSNIGIQSDSIRMGHELKG